MALTAAGIAGALQAERSQRGQSAVAALLPPVQAALLIDPQLPCTMTADSNCCWQPAGMLLLLAPKSQPACTPYTQLHCTCWRQ